jgi:tetratricopeptide (TPR) repeat protein
MSQNRLVWSPGDQSLCSRDEAKHHFVRALDYYNEALLLPLMKEVGDRNGEVGVFANMGLLYDAWRKPSEALNYYLRALQKMEELQVSARLEEFRIDVSGQSAGLYQRAIILEFNQHNMREAFELSERARARAFLDQVSTTRSKSPARLPAEFSSREEKLRKENLLLEAPGRARTLQAQPQNQYRKTTSFAGAPSRCAASIRGCCS